VFAGIALAGFAAAALALLVAHDDLMDEITRRREYQDLNLDETALTAVLWAALVVFSLWALVACVLAVFVWRGHNWARILLAISSVLAALFCLVTVPLSVLHLVASAVVVGLLFSPAANQWFRDRSVRRPPPGPPAPPYAGPPPPTDKPPVW
jgi:hypothetical protein